MSEIDQQIQARIERFVSELNGLLRQAAVSAVRDALGGNTALETAKSPPVVDEVTKRKRRPSRAKPRKATPSSKTKPSKAKPSKAKPSKAKPSKAKPSKAAKKPKGARRNPAEMQKQQGALLAYIAANPGQKMEVIAKALGATSSQMNRPINKLIASGAVRREGEKRASRYFAASAKRT